MDQVDVDRVRDAGKAILEVLHREPGGSPNTEALAEIIRLANDALHASRSDGYVSGKVTKIKGYADILYSARKHRRFDSQFPDGANAVRSHLASAAGALARWIGGTAK
jgi:hypothetical protein